MPRLVIKEFPLELHRKLKERAAWHHRGVAREVLALLERALREGDLPNEIPPPFKARFALTDEFINRARREGRK